MSESDAVMTCCRCCFSFVLTAGLAALFLWLSLRPEKPTCSIEYFSVFALNHSSPNITKSHNHTLYFDLKLNNNKNKDKGIYYDAINLTIFYKTNLSFPIVNNIFPAFYQGHEKKTNRMNTSEVKGLNWVMASADARNKTAVFKVYLKTAIRYKIIFWKTKRHRLEIGADLPLDDQGQMVRKDKKKGIKLTSGADEITDRRRCCYLALVVVGLLVF